MKKQATIKDVAKYANVSISTVSRALNGLNRVSDESCRKVKEAAEKLNYVPNKIAVSMVKGRTKNILVVVPDIINEYYTSVIHGVEEVMSGKGYTTIVYSSNSEEDKERELLTGALSKIIDGAVIVPASADEKIYKDFGKPIILVDRYIIGSGLPGVVVDNYGGSYNIMKKLTEKGHRDIGVILGELTFNIGQERLQGYEQALRERGIPIKKEYIYQGDWYKETGYNGMKRLLSLPERPTAVFATNNLVCIGCLEALKEEGLKTGKDISLIGFDDHILASFVDEGITVVARPTVEMGVVAAKKLYSALKGANINAKEVLNVDLIERNSIADIKNNEYN